MRVEHPIILYNVSPDLVRGLHFRDGKTES